MKTEEHETRPGAGERLPAVDPAAPEDLSRSRWLAILPGGDAARARREERTRRRLRNRQRRYQKSVARRRQRELASLERELVGRPRTRVSRRGMPFARPVADGATDLETIVAETVERALEDERDRNRADVEYALDMRARLLAKRLTRRIDKEVERRVSAELSRGRTKSPASGQRPGSPEPRR